MFWCVLLLDACPNYELTLVCCLLLTWWLSLLYPGGPNQHTRQQYRRMFSTTRLPGRDVDSLQQTSWSKHIAVLRRGHWFRVNMFDSRGTLLAAAQVEMMLQQVCDEADRLPEPSLEERQLPSLTAGS